VTDERARSLRLHEGSPAWDRLLRELPAVGRQFEKSRPTIAFVHGPRLAFRSDVVCGSRFALLPSAAGVIDPLLSTGFPLTLLGIHRLADALEKHWSGPGMEAALAAYASDTQAELDTTERLVAALYSAMGDFELFKRLGLLYFAAASYAETARRLGRPDLASGFLLCRHPGFGPESAGCAEVALTRPAAARREALCARILRAIAPFDVAGLGDESRRDWYPVLAEDLVRAAPRLQASEAQVQALLARCGFLAPAVSAATAGQ
jgi:FADH2 O2-dependent halogenase